MFSSDFEIPNAEVASESLLQKHKNSPPAFEPRARRCQAEGQGNPLSHVHSVIDRRENGNSNLYLIQWKACRTPEGNIGDKTWIAESDQESKLSPQHAAGEQFRRQGEEV